MFDVKKSLRDPGLIWIWLVWWQNVTIPCIDVRIYLHSFETGKRSSEEQSIGHEVTSKLRVFGTGLGLTYRPLPAREPAFFPFKMVSMNDFQTSTQRQNGVPHFNGFPAALFTFRCCVVTTRVWCFWLSQPAGHKSGKVRKSGKSRSRSRGSSRSPSRKGGKKSGKKSRSPSPTKTKREVDLLSPDAMSNGYYISHNVPQFLEFRGFGWDTGGAKGKKKKKGKGKKKK